MSAMEIKLTGKRGGISVVDDDQADLLRHKWNHLHNGYAARYESGKMIYLHREIMGFPQGEVDHIDGDKLNNRRSNLRACNRRTNATNSGKRYPRGKYGRNVTKMKNRKKPYHVQCWDHGRPVSGGYFRTLREARQRASELRKELGYVE